MRTPAGETTAIESSKESSGAIQRKCSTCEDDEKIIQRKPVSSGIGVPSQSPAHVSNAMSSGGRPLDNESRNFFEPRMGRDLGNVRVHTDSTANHSARAIDAKAYTLGNHIVFGKGEYRPESNSGRHLLAHELAHVTQSESSSTIRRDIIYRQLDRAQILAEIQMLRMQLIAPINPLRLMQEARLIQLQAMLNQTVGKPSAPSKPKVETTKPSASAANGNTNIDFYASSDDMTQLQLDERHRQLRTFDDMAKGRLGNQTFQTMPPYQAPQEPQNGCHVDLFAGSTGGTTCGGGHHKVTDEATRVSQKAMQMPPPDFSAHDAKERAMLDRLNLAHLAWKKTKSFVRTDELSSYEIEKDRIIPLWKRWDLFEKSDPEKDGIENPVEYYFRLGNEYIQEKERRITERPFKDRLGSARYAARSESNNWYSANEANEKMTGEDLWRIGLHNNLFIESEKTLVYKEQGSLQQLEREEREARQAQARRNFEIQQYRNHVARGEQLNSPTSVLQPFAVAAFGAPVAAVYGGMQLGFMGVETYHACKDGLSWNCAAAAAPVVATAVIHQAVKPKAPIQPPTPRPSTTSVPIVKPNMKVPPANRTLTSGSARLPAVPTAKPSTPARDVNIPSKPAANDNVVPSRHAQEQSVPLAATGTDNVVPARIVDAANANDTSLRPVAMAGKRPPRATPGKKSEPPAAELDVGEGELTKKPRRGDVPKRELISTAGKVPIKDSAWLNGRLPDIKAQREFLQWIEDGHYGEHPHLKPYDTFADTMLEQWNETLSKPWTLGPRVGKK